MSATSASQPSWQSQQRQQNGIPSYPQTQSSYDGQSLRSQQSWRPSSNNAQADTSLDSNPASSQSQQQQQRAFPGLRDSPSSSASGLPGVSKSSTVNNRMSTMDMGNNVNGRDTPPSAQHMSADQQQARRRTQSLRPLSAFQPLDHLDNGIVGNGNGDRPASPAGSTTRSIRTAAAPLTFKSPELRSALGLQDAQNKKIYMEGYLSRRDHLTAEGKPLNMSDPKKRWHLCFVQLSGTVLSVWSVQQMEEAARMGTEVPPSYINVTDCFVDFIGTITETPQEVPGTRGRYENVFAVNTAGQNRILFGVEGAVGRRLVQAWVNGIRLASWEKVRLEEIYTGSLVRARLGAVSAQQATSGPGGAPGDIEMTIKSPLTKGGRMEGYVKARFMGTTEWRKCWLVLTDKGAEGAAVTTDANADTASVTSQRSSFWSKLRGDRSSIMGSSSTPSLADTGLSRVEVPPGSNGAPGLACFYESKKHKKPFATLAYAAHAFAVYPSRPELVEGSSLFKVEGSFPLSSTMSATNRNRQTGWVMIMPELDGNTSKGANAEMMKWCIAFMDAFRLYGRPTQFQWDARNPLSPFFAYPIGPYKDRLFLDRELAEFLDIREERHLANRNNLHGIMAARMRGERTPILPPLPQPNAESTRNLNGPGGQKGSTSASNGSKGSSGGVERQALPPLNFGQKDENSSDSDISARQTPNDAPLAAKGAGAGAGGGLEAIGERSREGSIMTSLNTPISPGAVTPSGPPQQQQQQQQSSMPINDVQPGSKQGSQFSSRTGSLDPSAVSAAAAGAIGGGAAAALIAKERSNGHAATTSTSSKVAGSNDNTMPYLDPQGAPLDRGNSPSSFRTADGAPPAMASATSAAAISRASNNSPAPSASASNTAAAASAIPIKQAETSQPTRALQASGRGAEASQEKLSASGPPISRKVSDPYGSYDEGALYFINSMGDQPPAVSQPSNAKSVPATAPSAAPLRTESIKSEQSTAYNPRAPSTLPTAASANTLRPVSTQVEGIDQDALTAYSFLDQPPSPNMPTEPLPRQAEVPKINEPAVMNQAPQTYPSTFGVNKKTQERKMAAQAQAQAHQEAMSKPGRVGGAKKGLKQAGQRHAWADDESEEEEEEEEDVEDDERVIRPAPSPQGSAAAQAEPHLQLAGAGMPYSRMSQMSLSQQQQPARQSMFNSHLGTQHDDNRSGGATSSGSYDAPIQQQQQQRNTFVNLSQDQPGAMTTVFQPQGLLQAGAQDKADRSAKQQEAMARAEGTHMVNVDSKPPPPQAGLLGAISAHERDRKKDGGLGATLTERERERIQAERRQREEEAMRTQQQQQMQQMQAQMMQGQPPQWGGAGMPFNPMMWQQMQMMSMMNPQMMMPMFGAGGAQSPGSQVGHGVTPGGSMGGHGSPEAFAAQQQAQMMAAQAAQQAYMQAMSQHGGGGSMMGGEGGGMPGSTSPPMGMMPFNPFMSMYGAPPGFTGFMQQPPPGSEAGIAAAAQPPRMTASPSGQRSNYHQDGSASHSPLRR